MVHDKIMNNKIIIQSLMVQSPKRPGARRGFTVKRTPSRKELRYRDSSLQLSKTDTHHYTDAQSKAGREPVPQEIIGCRIVRLDRACITIKGYNILEQDQQIRR